MGILAFGFMVLVALAIFYPAIAGNLKYKARHKELWEKRTSSGACRHGVERSGICPECEYWIERILAEEFGIW